jgi:DNA-binding IclR family transcriptional regulator
MQNLVLHTSRAMERNRNDHGKKYRFIFLDKAISIPELIALRGKDLSLPEIGGQLRMGKGTVHRFRDTMTGRKFVHPAGPLAEVRKKALLCDREKAFLGVCCIALPTRDLRKETVAAISTFTPTIPMTPERRGGVGNASRNGGKDLRKSAGSVFSEGRKPAGGGTRRRKEREG